MKLYKSIIILFLFALVAACDNNTMESNENEKKDETNRDSASFYNVLDQISTTANSSIKMLKENTIDEDFETDEYLFHVGQAKLLQLNDEGNYFSNEEENNYLLALYVTIENNWEERIQMDREFQLYEEDVVTSSPSNVQEITPLSSLTEQLEDDNGYIPSGGSKSGFVYFILKEEDFHHYDKNEIHLRINKPHVFHHDQDDDPEATIDIPLEKIFMDSNKKEEEPEIYLFNRLEQEGDVSLLHQTYDGKQEQKMHKSPVTLEGYQFLHFKPNEERQDDFTGFENNEVVLLVMKGSITNKEEENIRLLQNTTLTFQEDNNNVLYADFFLPYTASDFLLEGETKIIYTVIAMNKADYDEHDTFELEIGPLYGKDDRVISKNSSIQFNITK